MRKHIVWRAARLLLAAELCLLAVVPVQSTGWETAVPAARTDYDPRDELVKPSAEETSRIEELLDGYRLTREQKQALCVRMKADSGLLSRLKAKKLTTADLARLALPNGRADRLDRYRAWAAQYPKLKPEDVVFQINTDQDRAFYDSVVTAADPDSLTVLVNKHYQLPDGFVPVLEELGTGYGSGSLRPEAARAFRAMADAAMADGISLRSVSAYRSYATQVNLYNRYLKNYGNKASTVDRFSARAGYSEHQTGLALDINVSSFKYNFEKTPAFAWLKEHCAEYGFILRYDDGKESITGYRFEPWHYRFVGVEAAQACMGQGLAYEEYVALLPG